MTILAALHVGSRLWRKAALDGSGQSLSAILCPNRAPLLAGIGQRGDRPWDIQSMIQASKTEGRGTQVASSELSARSNRNRSGPSDFGSTANNASATRYV